MLWICSALLLLIRSVEKGRLFPLIEKLRFTPLIWVILGILLWLSAQILNTPIIAVYRFGIYGFAFFLGYFVFSSEKAEKSLERQYPVYISAAAVLAVVTRAGYFALNYAVKPVVCSPLSIAFGWFSCLAVMGTIKLYLDRRTRFTRFMAKKSFSLYVFHHLFISAAGLFLKSSCLPAAAVYAVSALVGFAGAYILYEKVK